MTSSIQVSEADIALAKKAFEQGEGLSLEYRLGNVMLAMRSKDHSIAVGDVRERVAKALAEADGIKRSWDNLCPEGFVGSPRFVNKDYWLKQADAAITAIGSQSIELPDIHAEGERLASETPKTNGAYLWTDLVGAIQTGIAEERARHAR